MDHTQEAQIHIKIWKNGFQHNNGALQPFPTGSTNRTFRLQILNGGLEFEHKESPDGSPIYKLSHQSLEEKNWTQPTVPPETTPHAAPDDQPGGTPEEQREHARTSECIYRSSSPTDSIANTDKAGLLADMIVWVINWYRTVRKSLTEFLQFVQKVPWDEDLTTLENCSFVTPQVPTAVLEDIDETTYTISVNVLSNMHKNPTDIIPAEW